MKLPRFVSRFGASTIESTSSLDGLSRRRREAFGLTMGLCLVAVAGLAWLFISVVLARPARTPIVTLSGTYGAPWDVNPWVAEDIRTMETLADGTFAIHRMPGLNRLAAGFWDHADEVLRQAATSCPPGTPITVYVNLHGAVDDQGRPCLIPPGAVVNDASTWFPIQRLIDHVIQAQDQPADHPIVLLLECGRLPSCWPAGIAQNRFDQRLSVLIQQSKEKYPQAQLAILSSSSRGQRSYASSDGSGSIFTRFVADALGGAADGACGRADGLVDTDELHRFTHQRVRQWAWQHRGRVQVPSYRRAGPDSSIAITAVGRRSTRRAIEASPAPSPTEIARLTRVEDQIASLADRGAADVNPQAWSGIQMTLHAATESVFGGDAVRRHVDRLYSQLNRQFQTLDHQITSRNDDSDGSVDLRMARSAEVIWTTLAKQPRRDTAINATRDLRPEQAHPAPMLHALLQRPELPFWKRSDWVERTAKTQATWLQCVASLPDGIFPAATQMTRQVDEARRNLADALLAEAPSRDVNQAGPENREQVDAPELVEFENQVQQQAKALSQFAEAWRTNSDAFAQLPHLRPWMTLEVAGQRMTAADNEAGWTAVEKLSELLTTTQALKTKWDAKLQERIVFNSRGVADYLKKLNRLRTDALNVRENLSSGTDGRQVGTLARAIACPLLPTPLLTQVDARQSLRQWDAAIDAKSVTERAASGGASTASQPVPADVPVATLGRLLAIDSGTATPSGIRKKLRSLTTDDVQSTRENARERAVGLLFGDGPGERVAESMRRSRLAGEVDRVLDDFWYAPVQGDTPYFANTATRLIAIADASADGSPSWSTRKTSLTSLLQKRLKASAGGVKLRAVSEPMLDEAGPQKVSIQVAADGRDVSLPKGIARVSIGPINDDSLVSETVPTGDIFPSGGENALIMISPKGKQNVVRFDFRGNQVRCDVVGSDTALGVSVDATGTPPEARITVRRAVPHRRAMCFVLDCSASMNDPAGAEIARDSGGDEKSNALEASKLDAARSALYEMLRRLAAGDAEVGLVLYGHRMAIGKGDQGLLLQKRYFKHFPFPPTLRPYEDVEVALPTGRFDTVQLETARQHFQATVPWGQTPLHLAIDRAIDDVSRKRNDATKDVIVISDGQNYQFNPSADAIVPLQALVAKAKTKNVRIHIIGFGLSDHEAAAAIKQFKAIADGSGGKACSDVYHATELLKQLEKMSASDSFAVKVDGNSSQSAPLGNMITLADVSVANTPIEVTVAGHTHTLPLNPGDHLQLLAESIDGSLSCVPYLAKMPQFADLRKASGAPVPARLAIHRPHLAANDLVLRMSIQGRGGTVAPRPAFVWSEVSQLDPIHGTLGAMFRVGAVRWIDNMTCPVGEFRCRRWPTSQEAFSVRAWCCEEKPAGIRITLPPSDQGQRPLPDHDGIAYQLEQTNGETLLSLYYDNADSTDETWLAVETVSDADPASTHWYDAHRSMSVHSFSRNASADSPVEFWFGKVSEIKKQASVTQSPIVGSLRPMMAEAPATTWR